jgi:hypothetical protein
MVVRPTYLCMCMRTCMGNGVPFTAFPHTFVLMFRCLMYFCMYFTYMLVCMSACALRTCVFVYLRLTFQSCGLCLFNHVLFTADCMYMSMHICMLVCMYIRMFVYMYTSVCVWGRFRAYLCCLCVCVGTCALVYVVCSLHVCMCTYICMCVYICMYTWHICVFSDLCVTTAWAYCVCVMHVFFKTVTDTST